MYNRSLVESFEAASDPPVRGFLHRPETALGGALVLTHGAGSNCGAPLLVRVAETLAREGILVLRCDLPYRQAGRTGPPRPADAARDREGLRRALESVRPLAFGRLFLGGASYGGRQASMLAASDASLVDGLVLLSYPLHPPGKPGQLRTDHFAALRAPPLFIHGTRDPFGSPGEMSTALRLIQVPTRLLTVEGVGHDLGGGRKLDFAPAVARFILTGAL